MESEKVKEIKKALEEETLVGNAHKLKFNRIDFNLIKDALTLINELESENERLSNTEIGELIKENEELEKQCVEWSELNFKRRNKITELKDRIAELEKENESLYDSYHKGYKVGYEYGKQDAVSSDRAENDSQISETTQTEKEVINKGDDK